MCYEVEGEGRSSIPSAGGSPSKKRWLNCGGGWVIKTKILDRGLCNCDRDHGDKYVFFVVMNKILSCSYFFAISSITSLKLFFVI